MEVVKILKGPNKMNKFELKDALQSLGNTCQEVADNLNNLGIKGSKYCSNCPIAYYLISKGFRNVSVGTSAGVSAILPVEGSEGFGYWEPHTSATRIFVDAFDTGRFPSLELDVIARYVLGVSSQI